eukprot:scaffold9070_cov65-Cyclotella_meneghiniana.AAC.1
MLCEVCFGVNPRSIKHLQVSDRLPDCGRVCYPKFTRYLIPGGTYPRIQMEEIYDLFNAETDDDYDDVLDVETYDVFKAETDDDDDSE